MSRELYGSGRCKFHGGLSTGAKLLKPGPKTIDGKRRLWEGHQRWRAEQRRLKAARRMLEEATEVHLDRRRFEEPDDGSAASNKRETKL